MKKVAIISVLLSFLMSCNVLNFGGGEVTTDLKIESNEISNIQDIEATFTVRNDEKKAKKYDFSSGCQVSFIITQDNTEILRAEDQLICSRALTSFVLTKNESKNFELPNFFDINLDSGVYAIKAYLIGYESEVNATTEFVVN